MACLDAYSGCEDVSIFSFMLEITNDQVFHAKVEKIFNETEETPLQGRDAGVL